MRKTVQQLESLLRNTRIIDLRLSDAVDAWFPCGILESSPLTHAEEGGNFEFAAGQTFEGFSVAYENGGERVLLLGEPGAGKSTTLLQFALQKAREALGEPDAPVPVVAFVHNWDHKTKLRKWLAGPIAAAAGPVLFLFDGLDELGGPRPESPNSPQGNWYDPRIRFLEFLAEEITNDPTVVTCRSRDLPAVMEAAIQAPLTNAIRLLPLSDEQIYNYLSVHRKQSELWAAMDPNHGGDGELLELARIPLHLSMLSAAVTPDSGPVQFDKTNHGRVSAEAIFDFYLQKRYEHETQVQRAGKLAVKRALPYTMDETTHLLYRIALYPLFNHPLSSDKAAIFLPEVDDLCEGNGGAFIEMTQKLQYLVPAYPDSSVAFRFVHRGLRDYLAVTVLIALLEGPDQRMAALAAQELGQFRNSSAVSALARALNDPREVVRVNAAMGIGKSDDPAALEALSTALIDPEVVVRRMAVLSLGGGLTFRDMDHYDSTRLLVAASFDDDPGVRANAALALGKQRGTPVIKTLIMGLHDPDEDVRANAVNSLGQQKHPVTIVPLVIALQDSSDYVRLSALEALAESGQGSSVNALVHALDALHEDVRAQAANLLAKLGSTAAVPSLIRLLNDTCAEVRECSARALGKLNATAAIPLLSNTLQDPQGAVKVSAALALSKMNVSMGFESLISAYEDQDAKLRLMVVKALSELSGSPALAVLTRALKDPDQLVRIEAAKSIGKLGDQSAVDALVQALRDPETEVRIEAAKSIGKLGDQSAVDALVHAVGDPVSEVRIEAAMALGAFKQQSGAVTLVELLKDQNYGVQMRAAVALGELRAQSAVPALLEALKENSFLRWSAAKALEEILAAQ